VAGIQALKQEAQRAAVVIIQMRVGMTVAALRRLPFSDGMRRTMSSFFQTEKDLRLFRE
jgi:hypothetical protein